MAVQEELLEFVRDALARGQSRERIEAVLRQAGWPVEQITKAVSAYATVDFPVPVPRPRPYLSAREAFFYLLMFSALYLTCYYLGCLLFELINRAFPDPLQAVSGGYSPAYDSGEMIRWPIANLLVAFPVYLWISWVTGRALAADPSKRGSKIRRWLTYLTLFVAAGFVIGDVVTLIYYFLGGEMTVRFTLKVLTIGVIAGAVLGYYLTDLRREEVETA